MRTLIYVPVIHTSADLGSLAKDVAERGIADLGENVWEKHKAAVEKFWDVISGYFDSIDVSGMKIYQDGMVADGDVGQRIVEESAKQESRNYELVARLLKRGAILVKTEDFKLVKEERDRLVALTQAKSLTHKLIALIKYKLAKDRLLDKRDRFIAKKIDETLQYSEKGVLFIGACHDIKQKLPKDIQIREIKDAKKIKEYQNLLPFCNKRKERFEELGRYLISKVEL
jgi:pheromone shutdown protein TraB